MSKPRKIVGRRRKSAADRIKPFWILLVLFACVITFGGYYVVTWPGFRATHIVVIGNHRVGTKEIVKRAALRPRMNIWLQNMGAAADRIAAIPDMGPVDVKRGFPNVVTIIAHERHPFAVIRSGSGSAIVDRDLRVLTPRPGPAALPRFVLPVKLPKPGGYVKDERAISLRDDYELLAAANVVVVSLAYDRFGDLFATTPRGVQVLLGDDQDLKGKAALIGPILSQTGKKKIAAIDLRAPNTPVVKYK